MSDPNSKMLYDALRRVGVPIPEGLVALQELADKNVVPFKDRKYWHVSCGPFDTMIDFRDAASPDKALDVAVDPLQPWYVRKISFEQAPNVEQASRSEYVEWLQQGVK